MHRKFYWSFLLLLSGFFYGGQSIAAPAAPVLVSPQGNIETPTPVFVWQDQPDATLYRLYVYDRSVRRRVLLEDFQSADICDGQVCSVDPELTFGFGSNHFWQLKAGDGRSFTAYVRSNFDYVEELPPTTSFVAPTGVINTATPTYQWQHQSGVTLYRVVIRDLTSNRTLLAANFNAADICSAILCELLPAGVTLTESSNLFYKLRARNSAGWGNWSPNNEFSYQNNPLANEAPVATNDLVTVSAATETSIDILSNDSDLDGALDQGSVVIVSQPVNGSVGLNTNGSAIYTSNGTGETSDSFSYTVSDDDATVSNIATVSIAIEIQNVAPVAADDATQVTAGGSAVISVLSNDSDSNGSLVQNSVTITTDPASGSVSVNADGVVTYTHNSNSSTTDRFFYTVSDNDGAVSNVARVSIVVERQNVAPVAANDIVQVQEGGSVRINVLANDSDTDGLLVQNTVTITANPSSGSVSVGADGSINYTHGGSSAVTDNFSYTVADNNGAISNTATVTLSVNSGNTPPTLVSIIAPDGQTGTATPVYQWQPQAGDNLYRISIRDRTLRRTLHTRNYNASEICSATLCELVPAGVTLAESSSIILKIRARNAFGWGPWTTHPDFIYEPSGVNLAPVANADSATVLAGDNTVIAVLSNDNDSDGSLVLSTLTVTQGPSNGAASVNADGTISYEHNGSSTSNDSFSYTIADNNAAVSNVAQVSIAVAEQNQPPQAANDFTQVIEGDSATINVLANDSDSDGTLVPGTVTVIDNPASGAVTVNTNGSIIYAHNGNGTAEDSFSYSVRDNDGAVSNTATVTLAIIANQAGNQPPLVYGDSATVAEGGTVVVSVLANDTDTDGTLSPGTINIEQPDNSIYYPENGTLQVYSDGRIGYQHYGGPTTTDVFYYSVADNEGGRSVPVAVTISIGGATGNQPPQALADNSSVNSGQSVNINVLANDADSDGSLNTGSVTATSGTHGTVSVQTNGTVSYTHGGNTATADSFTYTVADNDGAISNSATVSVSILTSSGNQAPVAYDDLVQMSVGAEVTISVLANDIDLDSAIDQGSIEIISQPDHASSISAQQDGTVFYRNNGDGASTDSFSYRVTDVTGEVSNTATVAITLLPVVTGGDLAAFHRDGQTFLTWAETNNSLGYHVYRHSVPVTLQNLSNATKITSKWGALDNNTSVNIYGGSNMPANYVISDLQAPLSDSTGLFVYTTQAGDSATAYYAVTTVDNSGTESLSSLITVADPLSETVSTPSDVLAVSTNGGKGRIYTQFMDYLNWNATFNGYAYNYTLALPSSYDSAQSYPLMLELHAYGGRNKWIPESEYQWPVITLLPHDPGPSVGARHSWWYGYARDHNYLTDGDIPNSGAIANFTEQRVMRALQHTISHADYNVDENLVHAFGNSMGASGSMTLAIRYGSVISGVYASQPMTNYKSTVPFSSELEQLWGYKSDNLPIINRGSYLDDIQTYGLAGLESVGVWDWMNHHEQVVKRRGENIAYIMPYYGKQDLTIDWLTQGKPTVQAFTEANIGFALTNRGSQAHNWVAFDSVNVSLFGMGNGADFPWKYPLNLSFPAIQNASGSSSIVPANSGNDAYNMNIEWATPHTPFADSIVDQPGLYEITLRSTGGGTQTADITPRRTQQFKPNPGTQCSWTTTNNNNSSSIGSGAVTVDADSLLTVGSVVIVNGAGSKLSISCP